MSGLTQYKTPWSSSPIFSGELDDHGFPKEKRMQILNSANEVVAVARDTHHATFITSAVLALVHAQEVIEESEKVPS